MLQVSRSSCVALVGRVCEHQWVEPQLQDTTLGAHSNVSSHLSLELFSKPGGLGFTQSSVRHTHLALTTRRIDDFPLRGLPRMLWSPSSFEGEGKRGVHRTYHQFQQLLLHSVICRRCGARANRYSHLFPTVLNPHPLSHSTHSNFPTFPRQDFPLNRDTVLIQTGNLSRYALSRC